MSSIIQVENLSKSFIISHEGKEKYTALRDVMATKAKKIFSFPGLMKPKEKITKEEFWALNNLNFEVQTGDRLGIVGSNGAGKSTLLKLLSRITEPTKGEIRIKGRVASLLEVGTGFHPELTGKENIFLNGAILGMGRKEIKAKYDEIVDFAEVEKFLDTPVKRYSSGMYVRLAFAVAAHLEPEILVVDEVLAVGDAQFQKKCLGKMNDISQSEGRTVLFVSHNMGVISQLCNRVVLLSKGEISYDGTPKQAIEKYLQTQTKENNYNADETVIKNKPNHISSLTITNIQQQVISSFSFDENICLCFSLMVKNYSDNLQIGIALQDKYNTRLFTVIKELSYFRKNNSEIIGGRVQLPGNILAPNKYSFVVALWSKDGHIFDMIESVCPVSIHDNGTDLAQYEGADYGCIIIHPDWKTV